MPAMQELVKKLRKYEIQIRKAINSQMQGDFYSVFKGTGIEFEDIRLYQYGDDIRAIDWRSTAKYDQTFVKVYKETKEQSVFFVIDISASQQIGVPGKQKIDIGKEICGVLSLVALRESSQVGMISFSDVKEKFVRAAKGNKHAYEILSALFQHVPISKKTNINKAIIYTLNTIKRRSVIIFISDFIDEGYFDNLRAMANKHDLVVLHISDKRETKIPSLGIVPTFDKENNTRKWVNTSSAFFRNSINKTYVEKAEKLSKFCKKHQINYVDIDTDEDYVPKLIRMFKVRNQSLKRG
jgi:uncharacterized protein (DUF58 family)